MADFYRQELSSAIRKADYDLVSELSSKVDVLNRKNTDGYAPIHEIFQCIHWCAKTYSQLLEILLDNKADVTVTDSFGRTCFYSLIDLHRVRICHESVTRLAKELQSAKVINAQDDEGKTALFYAAEYGCERYLKLLVSCGAKTNITDNYRRTPADVYWHSYRSRFRPEEMMFLLEDTLVSVACLLKGIFAALCEPNFDTDQLKAMFRMILEKTKCNLYIDDVSLVYLGKETILVRLYLTLRTIPGFHYVKDLI